MLVSLVGVCFEVQQYLDDVATILSSRNNQRGGTMQELAQERERLMDFCELFAALPSIPEHWTKHLAEQPFAKLDWSHRHYNRIGTCFERKQLDSYLRILA